MTQAITCSLVPRSGAGMSRSGPMTSAISVMYRRVTRWSSAAESSAGLMRTPPFAPLKGSFITAHFHVIHMARALTSPRFTFRS